MLHQNCLSSNKYVYQILYWFLNMQKSLIRFIIASIELECVTCVSKNDCMVNIMDWTWTWTCTCTWTWTWTCYVVALVIDNRIRTYSVCWCHIYSPTRRVTQHENVSKWTLFIWIKWIMHLWRGTLFVWWHQFRPICIHRHVIEGRRVLPSQPVQRQ